MNQPQQVQPEPRDHHFVPQAFLRQWCGPDRRLCRMYKAYGKLQCRRNSPRSLAFKRDLYYIKEPGESLSVLLTLFVLGEKFKRRTGEYNFEKTLMQEIDDRGLKAHRKFLTDPNAHADENALYDLLRFIYILRARNPKYLERIQDASIETLEHLLQERHIQQGFLLNLDDLRRDWNAAKITVIEAVLNEPEFKRRYNNMACSLAHIDTNVAQYVTGDIPYVELRGLESTLHLIPLSPARCLVMSKSVDLMHGIKRNANQYFVEFINFVIIGHSNEVYAIDDREKTFVAENLGLFNTDPRRAADIMFSKVQKSIG
jgi:hypothetical protein